MEFSFPTRIIFGADTLNQLPELVTEHGMRHPMIVTDPGLVKAGLINQVTAALTNFSVFDCVAPNPTEDNIFDGVRHYIRKGCDGIVGVGGGSSLDAGKIIGLMTTHDLQSILSVRIMSISCYYVQQQQRECLIRSSAAILRV